jgi:hypothetical protein
VAKADVEGHVSGIWSSLAQVAQIKARGRYTFVIIDANDECGQSLASSIEKLHAA